MSAGHTPGPWRYRRERWPSSPCWIVEAELPCINGLSAWFPVTSAYLDAAAEGYTDGRLNPEADARLIATAPDLLSALEPFARLQIPSNPEGNAGFYSLLFEQIAAARAAVAKATGDA